MICRADSVADFVEVRFLHFGILNLDIVGVQVGELLEQIGKDSSAEVSRATLTILPKKMVIAENGGEPPMDLGVEISFRGALQCVVIHSWTVLRSLLDGLYGLHDLGSS